MHEFLVLFASVVFIALDSVYLQMMKGRFLQQIIKIQNGEKPMIRFLGAALSYLFLLFGLLYFIIFPRKSIKDAFLFGLVIYGVYESTNYALFKNWEFFFLFVDTLWGGILYALTTFLSNMIR